MPEALLVFSVAGSTPCLAVSQVVQNMGGEEVGRLTPASSNPIIMVLAFDPNVVFHGGVVLIRYVRCAVGSSSVFVG